MPRKKRLTSQQEIDIKLLGFAYQDAIAHGGDLFDHLGFRRRPSLEDFARRYATDDERVIDADRLLHDVHSHPETSERWRAEGGNAGYTAERFIHWQSDLLAKAEADGDNPETIKQIRDHLTALLRSNPIKRH